jgi:hypothetical protein
VHDRPVAGAVIREHALDADAPAAEEADGAAEEADGGRAFLVLEDFGVGEPGRVVDGDVDVLPADPARPIRPSFLTSMWTSSPGLGRS